MSKTLFQLNETSFKLDIFNNSISSLEGDVDYYTDELMKAVNRTDHLDSELIWLSFDLDTTYLRVSSNADSIAELYIKEIVLKSRVATAEYRILALGG